MYTRKQQIQLLEPKVQTWTIKKLAIGFIALGSILLISMFGLWQILNIISGKIFQKNIAILINYKRPILHETSPRFLSFGLDSSLLRTMDFPLKNQRFISLARYLNPAFIRVGGTSADCLFFNETMQKTLKNATNAVDDQPISNFTFSQQDYFAVYEFTKKAKLRMIFDLNVLIRKFNGLWDDSNARQILSFSKLNNMQLDWQLGNEPNSFRHVFNRTVAAKTLANDYIHLRTLLNENGYQSSLLVGPEANHIGDSTSKGPEYIQEFLENVENTVNFVTWHQYYLDGHVAKVSDFIKPTVFNRLAIEINTIKRVISATSLNISMWLSETSSAYGSGAPGISDTFVAGFLWLDKLGYSASAQVDVVIRQSLFGGHYALIGKDAEPNPDWWVSVLFKRLVSSKVLELLSPDNFGSLRMYAHCKNSLIDDANGVTLYGVNIDEKSVEISILDDNDTYNNSVALYILTSDNLTSRLIRLNGEPLKLNADNTLPDFKPIIINSSEKITLPPYSMVFIVIKGIHSKSCGK